MEVIYKNKKISRICTNADYAIKEVGEDMAGLIHQRIDEIRSSPSVEFMIRSKLGKCHRLKGNRHDQYAVHLIQPYRLVFKKEGDAIQIACILEIIDYH